jgi:hypothetical protein
MKNFAYFIVICAFGCLMACKKSNNNPQPAYPDPSLGVGTTTIFRNIIVNNVRITYSGGVPTSFELTNNAGTDIILTAAAAGTQIAIENEYVGTGTVSNVTANGSTLTYTNIVQSTDDRMNTDSIANKYGSKDVYVKIPVDKSQFGYNELHAFIGNDGNATAGQISATGSNQLTTSTVQDIFAQSKLSITKIDIK